MGCELGKLSRGGEAGGKQGSGRNCPYEPPAAQQTLDQRLPLTAKQKYSIIASWKGISRAMEPTGVYMFIKLFEEHEELLELFSALRALRTREQQQNSLELAEHATKVMGTLDESIRSLDTLDALVSYLDTVGALHRRIPGFQAQYFHRIEKPFLEAVRTTLGDRYTDNVDVIYQTTIKFIIDQLVAGYEKAEGRTDLPAHAPTSVQDQGVS